MNKSCKISLWYTTKEDPHSRTPTSCYLTFAGGTLNQNDPNIWTGSLLSGMYSISVTQKYRTQEITEKDISVTKNLSNPDISVYINKEDIAKTFNKFLDKLYG